MLGNEKEVGEGIKASGVPREEIFLVTKLNNTDHRSPREALEYSLKALDTPYLDLCAFIKGLTSTFIARGLTYICLAGLMHWPAPMTKEWKADKSHNWIDTWKWMEHLYKEHPDRIKAIGVSNVSIEYLEQLLKEATVVPAVNQVELHP